MQESQSSRCCARSINPTPRGWTRSSFALGLSAYPTVRWCLALTLALAVIRVLIELVGPLTRYPSCTLLYYPAISPYIPLSASRRPSLIEREPFGARFRNFQPIKKKIDIACLPSLSLVSLSLTHRRTYPPVIRLPGHVSGRDSQRTGELA